MVIFEKRRWIGPITLLVAGVLLLAAGVLVSTANRSDRNRTETSIDPGDGVARVSIEDAYAAYQQGSTVLVDVRSSASYENAHIPGSLSIPLSEFAANIGELDQGDWIITICA
jgi:hypothetical protein